jgi:hypothetical protein
LGLRELPVSIRFLLDLAHGKRRTKMKEPHFGSLGREQKTGLSRRNLLRGTAGAVLGAGLLTPQWVRAEDDDSESMGCVGPNPIPGGVKGLAPYGIFVHHNPLNPANPLANIHDPSQITDFDGFVGLTHIRGGGTGTDTTTGMTMPLAYQADMGFSQGKFVAADGRVHRGTLVFV